MGKELPTFETIEDIKKYESEVMRVVREEEIDPKGESYKSMLEHLLKGISNNPPTNTQDWDWASGAVICWNSYLRKIYGAAGVEMPKHPNL